MKATVEIVMATYNGEAYLKEQLDSVFLGTFQNFVLHVYDDGSTDATREILSAYQKDYPNRMVLHFNPENKGIIRNFLEGAKQTTADYVMFCDQDDVWLPKKIERTLRYMKYCEKKKGKELPITVFTDAFVVDENLTQISESFHKTSRFRMKRRDLNSLLMENKIIGCTMMINKSVIKKLEMLPQYARMHDWWIGLLSAAFGYVGYLREPSILYRQHGNNGVGSKQYAAYVKDRVLSLWRQKQALKATVLQGKEFYELFKEELSQTQKEALEAFISLEGKGFFRKRKIVWEYGFLKSTMLRNIGLLLLL